MRGVVLALCLLSAACAERPFIGVVITNSPQSIDNCGPGSARTTCP